MRKAIFIFLSFLLFISCEKEEGPGGKASIEGTLIVKEYNRDYSVLLDQYPIGDENVFIGYGSAEVSNDDIETSYNGKFQFSYLQPGDYTIWYYSDDTIPNSQSEISIERKINLDKKQSKNLGNLYTYKTKDFDDGSASICGKVYVINYKNTATPPYEESDIKDITPAQEEDMYLVYNDNETYNEDIETNYNGNFCFKDLIKGKYRVYVYSEDLPGGRYNINSENVIHNENSNGTFDLVLYRDVEITKKGESIQLDDFYVEQE